MTLRVCSCTGCDAHPGSCPNIVERGRCARCQRQTHDARGSTTEQGLGWKHQQRRRRLIEAALGKPCPDCGTAMNDPAQMVADHSTPRSVDPTSVADRVHCRRCSDRQGGRLSQQWRR